VRKTCAARSEDGSPFAKGEEVLVTKYDRGIAYVQRWEDFERSATSAPENKSTNS
jgi:hypothetical protein